jgi:molecular chaperone GrpE
MSPSKDNDAPRDPEHDEPLIKDKRRIDPETGELRPDADTGTTEDISPEDLELLQEAERDLVAEYRERAARAEAELANFRTRVERDRQANREAVIAEVIRSMLPVMDDLDRAEAHGDLQGTPLELVAQKLRTTLERHGVAPVGVVGEAFDPNLHEAMVRIPSAEATGETVAEVIEGGYLLGERLIRPAKVAVSVPAEGN